MEPLWIGGEAEQFQADPGIVFGFAGMISTGSGAALDNTMAGSLRIGRLWVASSELRYRIAGRTLN